VEENGEIENSPANYEVYWEEFIAENEWQTY